MSHLVQLLKMLLKTLKVMPEWMTTGTTYLITKCHKPSNASEYRPITCMTTLYKLTTKIVTDQLAHFVIMNNILSDNQLGTRKGCQGAKELAFLNKNINKEYNHKLFTTWFDIKKAFDSVNHEYLHTCLKKLKIPEWCLKFVDITPKKWKIN